MATKAQLEESLQQYQQLQQRCTAAESNKSFSKAIEIAVSSIPLLADVIRYQRKYSDKPDARLLSVTTILHYAPPLFLSQPIDSLEQWWLTLTKTERQSCTDLPNEIEIARTVMKQAAGLWSDAANSITPLPRPRSGRSGVIIDVWIQMGLAMPIDAKSFALITHLQRPLEAKCGSCGSSEFAVLNQLLGPRLCSKCGQERNFTIINRWI
jgi:hypothetical protein